MFKLFSFIHNNKNKLQENEKICKNHDFCHVKMPREDKKILEYNPEKKSLKVLFIIYANLECLFEKIVSCKSNPKES